MANVVKINKKIKFCHSENLCHFVLFVFRHNDIMSIKANAVGISTKETCTYVLLSFIQTHKNIFLSFCRKIANFCVRIVSKNPVLIFSSDDFAYIVQFVERRHRGEVVDVEVANLVAHLAQYGVVELEER